MPDKDMNITYETLFEILRREKSRDDLQELHESFFADVVEYLKDKTRIMQAEQGKLFSEEEAQKTASQMANIKKILKELYERREKKIINIALNKSRTKSNIINTSVLLAEEKELYDSLNITLDGFRESILANILNNRHPEVKKAIYTLNITHSHEHPAEDGSQDMPAQNSQEAHKTGAENSPYKKTKTVRFLKPIPKFVGPDLVIYGPFEEEDIASLPEEAAAVLIEKQRAEELENISR